jgi:hypothetical protein
MFKVIRIFERSGYKKTILRCVTEEIAQLHCRSKDVYEECC